MMMPRLDGSDRDRQAFPDLLEGAILIIPKHDYFPMLHRQLVDLRKELDDDISRKAFKTYLERLDGGKMFLLKANADALAKYADQLDDQLRSGSFELAHEGARLMASRVPVVEKAVAKLLRTSTRANGAGAKAKARGG